MTRLPVLATVAVLGASIATALRLAFTADPFSGGSDLLVGSDLMVLAVTAAAGVLLSRARWSRPLALTVLLTEVAAVAATGFDGWSLATLALIAAGMTLVVWPWPPGWLRRLPSSGGPGARLVVLLLGLAALPGVVGLATPGGPNVAQWLLAGTGVALAWSLSQAQRPAIWGVRVALALIGIPAVVTAPPAAIAPLAVVVATLVALGWSREAGLVARPVAPPRVPTYRIPPELAPPEVLDAAGLDESGRRLGR